jgi:phosphoglycolate phosphatase-like HAD superfamily hydrolase
MIYDLVIFDCDGVLFDSRRANTAFYNHIRSRFGLPEMTPSQIDFVHMATTKESVKHIIPEGPLREQAFEYCRDMDYEPFNRLMVVEPHLFNLLAFLGLIEKPPCVRIVAPALGRFWPRMGLPRILILWCHVWT